MGLDADLEAQVDRWRGYVQRRQAIAAADVDELEDHLRGQIDDLLATGLDHDEAFLVAIKRLGNLDAVSQEFAREHSDRLWKQLVLVPDDSDARTPAWRELAVVLAVAVCAGVAVKIGFSWSEGGTGLARNLGLLILPFLAGYFAWKRRLTAPVLAALVASVAGLAVLLNVYPFAESGSTELLAALHAPVLLWALVGVAYLGGRWRSDARRMDFVRFTGELAIYYTLLALGGAVLVALTVAVLAVVGIDPEPVLGGWILPFAVPGALVVAAWLVEAKQNVVENIAPVLTRVFTPLTIVMLLALLAVLATAGGLGTVDRDLLILMNAILVLVLCLLLYSISARDSLARPGLFDMLQLALVIVALAVDGVMLTAMLARITEFGFSANKIAALGLNLLLLAHLVRSAWLTVGFLRGRTPFSALERWQTRYLPVYGLWALVVVVVFPLAFGFA
ncbi:permease prefix domain 1-containing protein [Cryobacterium sp. 1639]|uniref:permease prefix domain 1-containing protein n=1 Tax=Cryobacterium inferilacus TaxID=2866629 RepID=UPI001C73401A|nr:permease prefix domain 1-containing protein [Cryobacterium sp. 1639]MBX0299297.1 permease prefix domain 1-containing protein [Cryobacterium sp. 1639]